MTTSVKVTTDEKIQKWIESFPGNASYELTGFKHGEYWGEKQLKLFLSKKD
tara:strand:- start:546 stop:698 length:153 start_codon:yes stop_codon:yes gene_type:complete